MDCTKCYRVESLWKGIEANSKRIDKVEKLFNPVSKLSVLFVICIFFLGGILGSSAYIWKSMERLTISQVELQKDIGHLTKETESIKKQISYTQNMIREHLNNGK